VVFVIEWVAGVGEGTSLRLGQEGLGRDLLEQFVHGYYDGEVGKEQLNG